MRIVSILSGLAVLFTTLAFGHLLHHFYVNAGEAAHSPPCLVGMAIGVVGAIFSFIGACLLLTGRGRTTEKSRAVIRCAARGRWFPPRDPRDGLP
jgi:hypothetical protein